MAELRRRKGGESGEKDGDSGVPDLAAIEKENEELKKLLEAKELNKKLKEQLAAGEGKPAPAVPAAAAAAAPPATHAPLPPMPPGLSKSMNPALQAQLNQLLQMESTIRSRQQNSQQLSESDREQLKQDITTWEKTSEALLLKMFASEFTGKKKRRRGARKILMFSVMVILLALAIAAAVRALFYQPRSQFVVHA